MLALYGPDKRRLRVPHPAQRHVGPALLSQARSSASSRLLFGPTVRDVNCAFKLFPRAVGQGLHADGALVSTELLVRARRERIPAHGRRRASLSAHHGSRDRRRCARGAARVPRALAAAHATRHCSTGSNRPRETAAGSVVVGHGAGGGRWYRGCSGSVSSSRCWPSTSRRRRCSPACTTTWSAGTRSATCRSPLTDTRRTSTIATRSFPGSRCWCAPSRCMTRDDVMVLVAGQRRCRDGRALVSRLASCSASGIGRQRTSRCGCSRSRRQRSFSSPPSARAPSSRPLRRASTTPAPETRARRSSPPHSRARSGSPGSRSSPRWPSNSSAAAGWRPRADMLFVLVAALPLVLYGLYMQVHIGDALALLHADHLPSFGLQPTPPWAGFAATWHTLMIASDGETRSIFAREVAYRTPRASCSVPACGPRRGSPDPSPCTAPSRG